ncbi:MAG TPA: hypothetical protein VF607_07185, partial [Verrucomicrobiae bacterium]
NHLLRGTQLGSQLAGCREAAFINTVPISVSRLPSCCAPGWIAAGDAAIKLDPVGSSGVATALAAGRRAAHAAAGVLSGRTEDLEPYRAWITRFAETFAAQRRKHYELEAGRRPSGFWSRRLQPVQQAQQPA